MPELTIEFRVKCAECGTKLKSAVRHERLHGHHGEFVPCVDVEPCNACMLAASEYVLGPGDDEDGDEADTPIVPVLSEPAACV